MRYKVTIESFAGSASIDGFWCESITTRSDDEIEAAIARCVRDCHSDYNYPFLLLNIIGEIMQPYWDSGEWEGGLNKTKDVALTAIQQLAFHAVDAEKHQRQFPHFAPHITEFLAAISAAEAKADGGAA